MLNPHDDIKITGMQPTFSALGSGTEPTYKVWFTVRGEGPHSLEFKQAGYDPEEAKRAILLKAQDICDTLDLF